MISGRKFWQITDADIVFNNGFTGECALDASYTAQIMTHEVGHTIGLGHSSERREERDAKLRDATMYFLVFQDGRGAGLRQDDFEGLVFIYPLNPPSVGDYSLMLTPATAQVAPGDTANYQIEFTPSGGFDSFVFFSFSGLPAGAGIPNFGGDFPLPFRITTSATTPPGSYTITVKGMGAGLIRTAQATLNVMEQSVSIANANYSKPLLRVDGSGLAGARILVNGVDVSARITSRSERSLSLNGNKKKLNLKKGANQVVAVAGNNSSNTFVLTLAD